MIYNTEAFFEQCIAKYLSCPGAKPLVVAHTPFVSRAEAVGVVRAAVPEGWDPDWRGGDGKEQTASESRAQPEATADEIVQRGSSEEPGGASTSTLWTS